MRIIFCTLVFVFLFCANLFVSGQESAQKAQQPAADVPATDSDYLNLFIDKTTLPGADIIGNGVFAKNDIPVGSIICEYRGPIVINQDLTERNLEVRSDKTFKISYPDGRDATIIGTGICSLINDCAWINNNNEIANLEVLYYLNSRNVTNIEDQMPIIPGYGYNSRSMIINPSKVFIVSTREIKKGEEIFYPYGR